MSFEVPTPILNGPFGEPERHWRLEPGEPPVQLQGRRDAGYYYRDPRRGVQDGSGSRGVLRPIPLANTIRDRVRAWREAGRPGTTRTTGELFAWWERDGRQPRLFFAQREAVETIVFLAEARADFCQGIEVPPDPPSPERVAEGYAGFRRVCTKMATGTGKSTVAAMLAAWSILNKVADRGDARFSDTVLIVCPNVTIRSRLGELDPATGEASLYRTRDLVPPAMMADLARGRMVITNWHAFEPRSPGAGSRMDRRGVLRQARERVVIAAKQTTARGNRYFTAEAFAAAEAAGQVRVISRRTDETGALVGAEIVASRYEESDTAIVNRVLGRGGSNVLVINDEAHHAYRIPPEAEAEDDQQLELDDEQDEALLRREATIWIDGLDRVQKLRGINLCIDLSATPYYLGRMGGSTNTVFPWVVSDFGLTDAIESGLVKVPQLVADDGTGKPEPAYFNMWKWITDQLTTAERGPTRGSPSPAAIIKRAHTPIAMLGGQWSADLKRWAAEGEARPPVFILVAKNTRIAAALFQWLGEGNAPPGIPAAGLDDLLNTPDRTVTIRVDTSVVAETDGEQTRSDENRWMRLTLDTVGSIAWPPDTQGRPVYPAGFAALAGKLGRPLHPPGRDIRCVVSVGMLTEGWDCNTVTHVIGLRPFQSQLLCEQVVGRALRRRSYQLNEDGRFEEEVAKVFGIPFEVVPFKAVDAALKPRPPQRRVYAVPKKAGHAIEVPNVRGFQMGVRNRISVADWATVAPTVLDPAAIPPTTAMAAALNMQRPTVNAPGGAHEADLEAFRAQHTAQRLAFQMAADLTRQYVSQPTCEAPAHVLFPQLLEIVQRYLAEKVTARPPAMPLDAFLSPYYGWIVERLIGAIRPDAAAGQTPELPEVDTDRPLRTADISLFTPKPTTEATKTHLNLVVVDSGWESQAAYQLDRHPAVRSFVKNQGLRFVIPYLHDGEEREYIPDLVVRLEHEEERYLIVEIKGRDSQEVGVKRAAAERWCAAVNATRRYGHWSYDLAWQVSDLVGYLDRLASGEDWRTRYDSNVRPLPSEGSALSS